VEEGDRVTTDQLLASVSDVAGGASGNIRSPIDGIVLLRAVEPGEIAPSGGALLVVADLSTVTLTVYVPEVHYGKIHLDDSYEISVDSYPNRTFPGTVSSIANQAEFTPRNAQSAQNRKNTVYAVKLTIPNANLDLKPGMPADVTLKIR
jgi:HlyD family secretion protein